MGYVRTIVKGEGLGEIFQFGAVMNVHGDAVGAAELADYVSNFIGLGVAGSGWINYLKAFISPSQRYSGVSAYGYSGTPDDDATGSSDGIIGVAQGTGTGAARLPLQTALVATVKTALTGASYRGRLYLPYTAGALGSNHQVSNDDTDAFVAIAGILLEQMQIAWGSTDSSSASGEVGVWSPTKNLFTIATHVTVDTRTDVQRRRAANQSATHVANHVLSLV